MKKAFLVAGVLLALTAGLASAQGGINLALNDCGSSGLVNAPNNPCTSNSGSLLMVASVMPPQDIVHMVAMEGVIDAQTSGATLSPWWSMGAGECRAGATVLDANFVAGPFSCVDYWGGGGLVVGGIDPVHSAPNRFRIKIAVALPAEQAMAADGSEYYMYKVIITRAKTTGTGACAGCTDAAGFVLNEIKLIEPATGATGAANEYRIFNPINGQFITYNGGIPGLPGATPATNRTWGQVKALYR